MDNSIVGTSDSGYIRLSYAELQEIRLVHLISGVDEDGSASCSDSAMPTAITGYTEWVATGGPVVSIGWDWQMLADQSQVQLKRISGASSNVMLQNAAHADLGHTKTALLLEALIDNLVWQPSTLDYVSNRYRN